MKMILALAIAGLATTAAHAGSKSVIVSVVDTNPVYYMYSVGAPENFASMGTKATVAPVTTSSGTVIQAGYGPDNQDAVYAKLLEEAQKRGLR